MSTFNTTRFSQALKCQFLVLCKTWIRLFGIFTLVMFMANLFFTRVQGSNYDDLVSNWPMEDVLRTYGRFVEQTVASVFWMMVITIGAYMLADVLRVFVDWVTGRVIIWGIPIIFNDVFGQAAFDHWQMVWFFFTFVFYVHSLYIVGGTLFRRQQFLFTSATIAVVGILLIMLLNQIHPDVEFISGTWDEKTHTYKQFFHPFFYILNTTLCALIVFHYWASYKLFTRMQVINNKWLNV